MTRIRLGVFYDGGWFSGLWKYLAEHSAWKQAPAFLGVHDALRWHLHQHGHPLDTIRLACAHYVLGRPDPGRRSAVAYWDQVLARYGIVRHDARHLDGHEVDADDLLQQVAYAQAMQRRLDAVALISGDSDLLPVVTDLTRTGLIVVVPSLPNTTYTAGSGRRWIGTSPRLTEAATHAPDWNDLLTTALQPDYPLAYPFLGPVPGAVSQTAADGYRYGTVNRWDPDARFGFITDRGGLDWYVCRPQHPDAPLLLPLGQPVRFTGGLRPAPGRRYPQVRSIEPYEPHGLIPHAGHRGA